MQSSNFLDFIHCASRICLGQNVKALVWRWRRICPLKTYILTLNAPILTNEVSMFQLAIEVCFENNFGLIHVIFLSLGLTKSVYFLGTPGTSNEIRPKTGRASQKHNLTMSCRTFAPENFNSFRTAAFLYTLSFAQRMNIFKRTLSGEGIRKTCYLIFHPVWNQLVKNTLNHVHPYRKDTLLSR